MQVLFKEVIFSVCCSIDPDFNWNFFCFFDPAFEVISFYRKIQSFSFKIDSDYFFRVGTTILSISRKISVSSLLFERL